MSDGDDADGFVDVDAAWTGDVGIRQYTNTDIDQTRTKYTRASSPNGDLHVLAETLRREANLETTSEALDRALRVEVASLLDNRQVPITREDYDVAYTIPPRGWLSERVFGEIDLFDESEVDTSMRSVGVSMPPVVFEMAQVAVEDGLYETLSSMIEAGVERLLGRRSA